MKTSKQRKVCSGCREDERDNLIECAAAKSTDIVLDDVPLPFDAPSSASSASQPAALPFQLVRRHCTRRIRCCACCLFLVLLLFWLTVLSSTGSWVGWEALILSIVWDHGYVGNVMALFDRRAAAHHSDAPAECDGPAPRGRGRDVTERGCRHAGV